MKFLKILVWAVVGWFVGGLLHPTYVGLRKSSGIDDLFLYTVMAFFVTPFVAGLVTNLRERHTVIPLDGWAFSICAAVGYLLSWQVYDLPTLFGDKIQVLGYVFILSLVTFAGMGVALSAVVGDVILWILEKAHERKPEIDLRVPFLRREDPSESEEAPTKKKQGRKKRADKEPELQKA